MGKAPAKSPPARKRKHHAPARKKSTAGKVTSAVLAVAGTTGVMTGLYSPTTEPMVCGGSERWSVKVANDPDAGQIAPNAQGPFAPSQLNQLLPGPLDAGGRMALEKKRYTIRGYLSYFKHELGASGDRDYHVVITDHPGQYEEDEQAPPNGHSVVVELPDPKCFGGAAKGAQTSVLGQSIIEARREFEQHVKGINGKHITTAIPVTVTGVGFFDRAHHQTGRSTEQPQGDGRKVVFELHPVTEITFDAASDPD